MNHAAEEDQYFLLQPRTIFGLILSDVNWSSCGA